MCTDRQADRKSDHLISTNAHYVQLGGDNKTKLEKLEQSPT